MKEKYEIYKKYKVLNVEEICICIIIEAREKIENRELEEREIKQIHDYFKLLESKL